MTAAHLPYLCSEVTRHGRRVWYVRVGNGPRVRVQGEPGQPDFPAAYLRAIEALGQRAQAPPKPAAPAPGSMRAALRTYLASESFARLGEISQRRHRRYLEDLATIVGDFQLSDISRAALEEYLRGDTQGARQTNLKMIRRLFAWALDMEMIERSPAERIKGGRPIKEGGHEPWTRAQVAACREVWAVGTMPRMALELLLNTCARRSDLVMLGRQHIRTVGGIQRVQFRPAKTAGSTSVLVDVRVGPQLAACLERAPAGALALLTRQDGQPFASGNSFANVWKDWQRSAKLDAMNLHGVRKLAAEMAAEAGATVPEIMALLGHTRPTQAMQYAARYARAAAADAARDKMGDAS